MFAVTIPFAGTLKFIAMDVISKFVEWISHERVMSEYTVRSYNSVLKQFFEFLNVYNGGEFSINEITLSDVRAFLAYRLNRGVKSSQMLQLFKILKTFFRFLKLQNIETSAQMHLLKRPRHEKKLPRPLTPESAQRVVVESLCEDKWIDLRDFAFFTLLYSAGLRIMEALSLNLVDWPKSHKEFLKILGKGHRRSSSSRRMVPVPVMSAVYSGRSKLMRTWDCAPRPYTSSGADRSKILAIDPESPKSP